MSGSAPARACRPGRPALGVLLACGLVGVVSLLSAPGRADAPDRHGWWYRFRAEGLAFVPAPPTVPPDGLYVARDAVEPLAVAALHFTVSAGAGEARMTLRASPGATFTGATIAACPATGPWTQAWAGNWTERPSFDGNRCAEGSSEDGAAMVWTLTGAFQRTPASYEVVLVPGGAAPFQVAMDKPDSDTFDAPPPAGGPRPPEPAPTAIPSTAEAPPPFQPVSPQAPPDLISPVVQVPPVAEPPPLPPLAEPPPFPAAAAPAGPSVATTMGAGSPWRARLTAGILLALLAGTGLWLAAKETRPPQPLIALAGLRGDPEGPGHSPDHPT